MTTPNKEKRRGKGGEEAVGALGKRPPLPEEPASPNKKKGEGST